jgi:hypothetical protein
MNTPGLPKRPLRVAALAAVTAVSAFALTACGGSGGPSTIQGTAKQPESSRSAGQILSDVRAAVAKATSVHVLGHVDGASAIGLNLRLDSTGGSGTISTPTFVIRITRVGKAAYYMGSKTDGSAFYTHFTTAAGAHMLHGRWLKVPTADTRFTAFSSLTDMQELLTTMLKPKGTVVKAGTRTLHGVPAIGLRDSAGDGTLYVAATGAPYPLELVQSGAHSGVIVFEQWNRPLTLTAPAHPFYLAQLPPLDG